MFLDVFQARHSFVDVDNEQPPDQVHAELIFALFCEHNLVHFNDLFIHLERVVCFLLKREFSGHEFE